MSRDLALRQQAVALVESDSSPEFDGHPIDDEHRGSRLGLIVAGCFFVVFLAASLH
jgi:hypothetical protein